MSSYPRESQELVLFDEVLVNGVPTVAYTWQIVPDHERPVGAWQAPIDAGGGVLGFMLLPAPRGTYRVFVRIVVGGQSIVVRAGELERT